jgi:hypothetical protein
MAVRLSELRLPADIVPLKPVDRAD